MYTCRMYVVVPHGLEKQSVFFATVIPFSPFCGRAAISRPKHDVFHDDVSCSADFLL